MKETDRQTDKQTDRDGRERRKKKKRGHGKKVEGFHEKKKTR